MADTSPKKKVAAKPQKPAAHPQYNKKTHMRTIKYKCY
jgi:hypothetical protein